MRSHDLSEHAATTLPPLRTLQAAVRETTETLARELAIPSSRPPQWNDLEWRIAEAVAVMHGMSALLVNRLRWHGPQRWQAFLEVQKHHIQARHARSLELLAALHAEACRLQIVVVALKGSALYAIDAYPNRDRPMGDVDLLVHQTDMRRATQMLNGLGFQLAYTTDRHHTFERAGQHSVAGFGEHADNPLKVDLHCHISERLPVREVDITPLVMGAASAPGLNPYPSIAALMRHVVLHTAGALRARNMRFIQIQDIARLAARMNRGDWEELVGCSTPDRIWWAYAPLAMTKLYYPNSIPEEIVEISAGQCPRWLRRTVLQHRLSDVSLSRLRIQAFPGIEWCHNPIESVRFVRERLFPHSVPPQEREAALAQPFNRMLPWSRLSHGRRILRWLFSNPPRLQALYPIRVVLGIQPP